MFIEHMGRDHVLRLAWVVGQAGIILTIAIIMLNLVTSIINIIMCNCNKRGSKGGGAYYLISRALGPTYGGVIGLLFFLHKQLLHLCMLLDFLIVSLI